MKRKAKHIFIRWASGIFMMLVLVWLTVSTPFVNAFQMQMAERDHALKTAPDRSATDTESTDANLFANTTEEKTESGGISFSEEYLHDHHELLDTEDDYLKHEPSGHSALYIAFHGELLSPPPEA